MKNYLIFLLLAVFVYSGIQFGPLPTCYPPKKKGTVSYISKVQFIPPWRNGPRHPNPPPQRDDTSFVAQSGEKKFLDLNVSQEGVLYRLNDAICIIQKFHGTLFFCIQYNVTFSD